jgi:hypothetical protein
MHKERELLRDTAYQLDAFIEGGYFPNPHVLLDAIIVLLNEAEEAQPESMSEESLKKVCEHKIDGSCPVHNLFCKYPACEN